MFQNCLDTPPPGILQKSPQTIENKGNEIGKERQERKRVRKYLKRLGLRGERIQGTEDFGSAYA